MPAPAVSPNDLTRQQLDELDALLQRMLSLPLQQPAAQPARLPDPPMPEPARAAVRTDPPAPVRSPHLVIPPRPEPVVLSTTVPAGAVAEMRSFTPPAPKPFEFPAPERLFGPSPSMAEPEVPAPFPVPPTVEDDAEPVALEPAQPAEARPALPFTHWPIFGTNWLLERTLGLFGPPGQSLRTPVAKTVLGGAGVLLLIAAGVWAARGMGWVHFDWPR